MLGALRKRADKSRLRWLLAPIAGVVVTGSLLFSAIPAQSAPTSSRAATAVASGGGLVVDVSTGEAATGASTDVVACTITGTSHRDVLHGTAGDDVICGLGGADVLLGDTGDDMVLGGRGADHVDGGAGNDVLRGNTDDDVVAGGTGDDTLNGGPDLDQCVGGADTDTAVNCEHVNGVP